MMNDKLPIEDRVNQALDDSVENLSPDVRRRLNQIRMEAVERKSQRRIYWQTASAMSLAIAIVLGWQLWPAQSELSVDEYAEVLDEDFEMLDDLEFVYWIAEENGVELDGAEENNSAVL